MNPEDKEKKEYEISFLFAQESDLAGMLTFVAQHGGEVSLEPKSRNVAFAYEIKGKKEGVFAYLNFRALPEDAKTLEHDLNSQQSVLRFLIISSPPPAEKLNVPMGPIKRRGKPVRSTPSSSEGSESTPRPAPSQPLSNEALEKKIEEILQ